MEFIRIWVATSPGMGTFSCQQSQPHGQLFSCLQLLWLLCGRITNHVETVVIMIVEGPWELHSLSNNLVYVLANCVEVVYKVQRL